MANERGEPRRFTGFRNPTYTQVPDELFDELMTDLSGAELKVLLYIVRRTFGFKRESDSISLSQMLNGLHTADGRVLDRGAGVSKPTLLQALRTLEDRNVIETERRRSAEKGDEPTVYRLKFADDATLDIRRSPVVKKVDQGVEKKPTPPVVKKPTPQETVERHTDFDHSNIRRASAQNGENERTGETLRLGEAVAQWQRDRIVRVPPNGRQDTTNTARATGVTVARQRPAGPRRVVQQDEDYQTIQSYVADFARELNDKAPLKASTTRAYNLYKRSGATLEVFIQQLYAARSIVKERTGSIRSRGDTDAWGVRMTNRAAYYYAVLEDLLGLRDDQPDPSSRNDRT